FLLLLIGGGIGRLYAGGYIGGFGRKELNVRSEESVLRVHVKGAVRDPGVYALEAGARWIDAVNAAGGLLPGADGGAVNLARFLRDGDEVYIPEAAEWNKSGGGRARRGAGTPPAVPVDINTATKEELIGVPGIGPVTADRIIETRNSRGSFRTIEEIMLVKGIGTKRFLQIRDYICVRQVSGDGK
ncbi:MAG: helix-hairpin-helix domain-containing protein, partial [bacterium]